MSYAEIDMPMVVVVLSHSVSFSSATPWTVALQVPLSMDLSRQEFWRGLPFLPHQGMEPISPHWQVVSLLLCHLGSPR